MPPDDQPTRVFDILFHCEYFYFLENLDLLCDGAIYPLDGLPTDGEKLPLPTAEELIEGLKYYIREARSYGYKVYVGTLLPIEGWRTYAPFREEIRHAFNEWIRTTDLIDGCIDFDKAVCDPERPTRFLPEYDSGDHLHPSKAGYKRMADIVPDELLR